MTCALKKSESYLQDFANQARWYVRHAGEDVARRFEAAADHTVVALSRDPELGRVRRFKEPRLRGLRPFRVEPPFNKLLIFYRWEGDVLEVWPLMHGARDLGRRLLQLPASEF